MAWKKNIFVLAVFSFLSHGACVALAEDKVPRAIEKEETAVAITNSPENAESIKASIIAEARWNGIDEDFDLPGLEAALDDMKKGWELRVDEIELIVQYAPKSGKRIPIVVAYLDVNGDLDNVNGDLEKSEEIKKAIREIKKSLSWT